MAMSETEREEFLDSLAESHRETQRQKRLGLVENYRIGVQRVKDRVDHLGTRFLGKVGFNFLGRKYAQIEEKLLAVEQGMLSPYEEEQAMEQVHGFLTIAQAYAMAVSDTVSALGTRPNSVPFQTFTET